MKYPYSTRFMASMLAILIVFAGCASSTLIQSTPEGATVYVNGQKRGITPFTYTDTRIVGSTTPILLKKEGYKDIHIMLCRDEQVDFGAVVGGLIFWVPFLWTLKYDDMHSYEMEKLDSIKPPRVYPSQNATDELIKLKNLLDQGTITKDDFATLKVRILNDTYNYNNSAAEQIKKLKSLLDAGLLTKEEFDSQKKKVVDNP